MTIEDGSSLSQSETHLEVFENLVESDCTMLRDIVNNQLIPRMVKHGFPVKGLRFEWDDAVDYTPEQQVAYETMIADRYEVDPMYFAESTACLWVNGATPHPCFRLAVTMMTTRATKSRTTRTRRNGSRTFTAVFSTEPQ